MQALIFDATHADAAPTPAALPTPPLLFVARGTADGAVAFDPLADTAPAAGSVPVAAEDSDVILYTSGTTGRKARG